MGLLFVKWFFYYRNNFSYFLIFESTSTSRSKNFAMPFFESQRFYLNWAQFLIGCFLSERKFFKWVGCFFLAFFSWLERFPKLYSPYFEIFIILCFWLHLVYFNKKREHYFHCALLYISYFPTWELNKKLYVCSYIVILMIYLLTLVMK